MSLQLDDRRLLPTGIYSASVAELQETFGGFQRSDRRAKLAAKLAEYVDSLRRAEIRGSLLVDGSFVMGCVDEPEDIDLVLVLASDWDMTADLSPYQYNLVSKKDVKRTFPFDVYPVRAGSAEETKWTSFFEKVNIKWYEPFQLPDGSTKGLVRIVL